MPPSKSKKIFDNKFPSLVIYHVTALYFPCFYRGKVQRNSHAKTSTKTSYSTIFRFQIKN